MHHKYYFLILPYTRLELPGWGTLLNLLKIQSFHNKDERFKSLPTKIIRGKLHGYKMKLDLSDWCQRMTYFLGRYYELEVQQLLSEILSNDDRFIDIGANIGMISLCAAGLVGKNGEVECFEPNPDCVAVIQENINLNGLTNITIHPVGLSDQRGELNLNLANTHTGTATFADIGNPEKSYKVEVLIGDDVLLTNKKKIKLIKIDVEGFELHVLKGLKRTLDIFHPFLITEFVESHFQRANTTGREIKNFLFENGYTPYGITKRRKLFSSQFVLVPIKKTSECDFANDLLWIHQESFISKNIERHISKLLE